MHHSCHAPVGGRTGPAAHRARAGGALLALSLLLLTCLGLATPVAASPHEVIYDPDATPSWSWHSGGPHEDRASDVVFTSDRVAYVCGAVTRADGYADATLMRFVDGEPAWSQPRSYDSRYHRDDVARHIATGPDGSLYTAGWSENEDGVLDMLLIKWSASGNVSWARRYDGPARGIDVAGPLGVDARGNVAVAGVSLSATDADWAIVSWSSGGTRRWTYPYDGGMEQEDNVGDLLMAGDGSVYVTGAVTRASGMAAMTMRLSANGRRLWAKAYRGPEDRGAYTMSLAAAPGGGVYAGGLTRTAASGTDGLVVRFSAAGARSVLSPAGGAGDQAFKDIAVTSTGRVVGVGSTGTAPNTNGLLVVYTADGTIGLATVAAGPWRDEFEQVAVDDFGGYYAAGVFRVAAERPTLLTVRDSTLTAGGGWASRFEGPVPNDLSKPSAIAVRRSTAIVVGGATTGPGSGLDQIVLGYVY